MTFLRNRKDWILPIILGLIFGTLYSTRHIWIETIQSTLKTPKIDTYAEVLDSVLPFTVSIYSNRTEKITPSNLTNDPYFSKFIENIHQQETSLGSGILISKNGTVVTNAHVIREADDIVIVTSTGQKSLVSRTIIDPESDIAILETSLSTSSSLPINLLDSERVGDIVFTIGNPFGIGQSVSMGIISAIGRRQPNLTSLTDFIQTDAAINPGNSGGALVNSRGEVIGMNTAIFSSTGGSQGIGFAIPFSHVLKVSGELSSKGLVTRGYLGVDVVELSPIEQSQHQLNMTGLRVISVKELSPAENAGLRTDDILISINGMKFSSRIDAARFISQLMPGKTTTLTILREKQTLSLSVKISTRP